MIFFLIIDLRNCADLYFDDINDSDDVLRDLASYSDFILNHLNLIEPW